jgi:hypothetical protein
MRSTVNDETASSADAFATITVECYGFFTLRHQSLVEQIEHLEQRLMVTDIRHFVTLEVTLLVGRRLTPHVQYKVHCSHYL